QLPSNRGYQRRTPWRILLLVPMQKLSACSSIIISFSDIFASILFTYHVIFRSFRQRALTEDGCDGVVRRSEPLGVQVPELLGGELAAERSVHDQSKIVVVSCQRQSDRLGGEQPIEDHKVGRRRASGGRFNQDGPVTEEDVGRAIE